MSFPHAAALPRRQAPVITLGLVLACYVVFGVIASAYLSRGAARAAELVAALSLTPSAIRWHSPITYLFLHADVLHLSSNMLFLWLFGGPMELALGWRRFAAFVCLSAVATGMLEVGLVAITPSAPRDVLIVGFSGVVSALAGAFIVRYYRHRVEVAGLRLQVPAVGAVCLALLAEMIALGLQVAGRGDVRGHAAAHGAHVGGFLLGMAWAQAARLSRAASAGYAAAEAESEMRCGSPVVAAQRYEALLAASPGDSAVELQLARCWALAGDREQACVHFTAVVRALVSASDRRGAAAAAAEMSAAGVRLEVDAALGMAVAAGYEEGAEWGRATEMLDRAAGAGAGSAEGESALLRAAALRIRRLGAPAVACAALEAFLGSYPSSANRDFAETLLREGRAAVSAGNTGADREA